MSRSMCNVSRICNRWTGRRSWRDCGPSSSLKQMAKMKREINEIRQQVIVILRHPRTRVNFIFIFIFSQIRNKFTAQGRRQNRCLQQGRKFVKDRYIRRTFEMGGGGSKEDRGVSRRIEKYQPSLIYSSLLFPIKWTSLCYSQDDE